MSREPPTLAGTRIESSQGVARSCGYVFEGRMPRSAIKAGRVIDRVLYARYRNEVAA